MPSFNDVGDYLDTHRLESELSDAVALCVEDETPQPYPAIADRLLYRGAEMAVAWDYGALCADLRALIKERRCGPLLIRLSFQDACAFSAALHPNGAPNAALRFTDGGEGCFAANAGLATEVVPLLEPLKTKYPLISRADLWALAANVALESMGGPKVFTRFGRRDAVSFADGAASPDGRLPDETGLGLYDHASYLRRVFSDKGLNDRELVALQGRHCVGECVLERGAHTEGAWTADPFTFDNTYFTALLHGAYEPHGSASGHSIHRDPASGTIMLPTDMALLRDKKLRAWVEKFAADPAKFAAEFGAAWAKLQELGCADTLAPHPASLTYASGCYVPEQWLELPLVTRRELTHNTTVYGFGLPKKQSLNLPVCACLLVRAPGRGRGSKGKDDWDGSDAVRPYTPISDNDLVGRFELLVKRYEGGAVSQYLHGLRLGAKVAFKHIKFNIKAQYPFAGKQSFTFLCAGTGITPVYQALWKLLKTHGDDRRMVLMYSNRTPQDILLKDELDEWARTHPDRLTIVHVVGNKPDDPPPPGWKTTNEYTAESGWIDEKKIQKYAFEPSHDTLVFVCGLPPMYAALCGPRDTAALSDGCVLANLGYKTEMVAKL